MGTRLARRSGFSCRVGDTLRTPFLDRVTVLHFRQGHAKVSVLGHLCYRNRDEQRETLEPNQPVQPDVTAEKLVARF